MVGGVILACWGIWYTVSAPKLAARYAEHLRKAPARRQAQRPLWMSPVGCRLVGLLWCALGLWGILSAISTGTGR